MTIRSTFVTAFLILFVSVLGIARSETSAAAQAPICFQEQLLADDERHVASVGRVADRRLREALREQGAELVVPAFFQFADHGLPEFGDAGGHRVEGQALVEERVEPVQVAGLQGGDQLATLVRPVAGGGCWRLDRLGLLEQLPDLADRYAAVEPLQDALDALDVVAGVEAVPLGGTAGADQPVTALLGPQGDRVDAGQPGDLPDRVERRVGRMGRLVTHGRLCLLLIACPVCARMVGVQG